MTEVNSTISCSLPVKVYGRILTEIDLPKNLYIPPDALRVLLTSFEGPLDILLYLIKKQNLDILDIPIAEITKQYLAYINLMQRLALELAADYLVMAAMLAEIKSKLLLPRDSTFPEETEGEDPRLELARRLENYAQFKQVAQQLDQLPRITRDYFIVQVDISTLNITPPIQPEVTLAELVQAWSRVMIRTGFQTSHRISIALLSVEDKISAILSAMTLSPINFTHLIILKEGRLGVIVTFLALLELLKQRIIECEQSTPFSSIELKKVTVSI